MCFIRSLAVSKIAGESMERVFGSQLAFRPARERCGVRSRASWTYPLESSQKIARQMFFPRGRLKKKS